MTELRDRFGLRGLAVGLGLAGILLLAALALGQFAPIERGVVDSTAVRGDGGLAFAAPVPVAAPWPWAIASDSNRGLRSRLSLFENERALYPGHSLHADIRDKGGGRYSHWTGGVLHFSTADGSDPRTNGRTYSVSVEAEASPTLFISAMVVAVASILLFGPRWSDLLRAVPPRRALAVTLQTLRVAALLVPLSALGAWIWLEAFPPKVSRSIPVDAIKRGSGQEYLFQMAEEAFAPFVELRVDGPRRPKASRLVVLEDGNPLGPAHAAHESVRQDGRGAYSHWQEALHFSSSDGTSPVENGRSYGIVGPLAPSPLLRGIGVLALASLALLLGKRYANTTLGQRAAPAKRAAPGGSTRSPVRSQAADRPSGRARAFLFLAVATTAVAILGRLIDRYYLHVFEPDAQTTIDLTLAVASGDVFFGVPEPGSAPPYFDAQYYFYAIAYHLARLLRWVNLVSPEATPTPESLAILAVRYTNVVAYSIGVGTSALLFKELSGRWSVALVLACYVLLSPQMLGVDLMRLDHLILALFLMNLYLALQIARCDQGTWVHVSFGIAAAALILTKISSIVLLLVPIMGYASAINSRGVLRSGAIPWAMCLVGSAVFFLARFVPHEAVDPGFTFGIARAKLEEVERWGAVFPLAPRFFYNWDQFTSYGPLFLAVSYTSVVWVASRLFRKRRAFADALVIGLLGLLSVIGYFSFKYPRGIYFLAPLYLAVIACAFSAPCPAAHARAASGKIAKALPVAWGIGWLALVLGLAWPIAAYVRVVDAASAREHSMRVTKLEPGRWLSQHLWPGARVTVFRSSQWANPVFDEVGYDLGYRFLDFPQLEPARMIDFHPPSLDEVDTSTDAIILNDFHIEDIRKTYLNLGRPDLRGEWDEFFDLLRKTYLVKRFEAATPAYGVRVVEVVVVHDRKR